MLINPESLSSREEIKTYIKRASHFGLDPDKIRNNLRIAGYRTEEVEKSFQGLEKEQAVPFPPTPPSAIPSSQPSTSPPPFVPTVTNTPQAYTPFLSLAYYQNILLGTRKISVFLLLLMIALLNSLKPIHTLITNSFFSLTNFQEKVEKTINEIYPPELQIKINYRTVSCTIPSGSKENLFTLGLSSGRRLCRIHPAESVDTLRVEIKNGSAGSSIKAISLKSIEDLAINKQALFSIFNKLNENRQSILLRKTILFSIPFFIITAFILIHLFDFFLTSLIIFLLTKVKKQSFTFANTFAYTTTLSFVPTVVLTLYSNILFPQSDIVTILKITSIAIVLFLAYRGIAKLSQTNF